MKSILTPKLLILRKAPRKENITNLEMLLTESTE